MHATMSQHTPEMSPPTPHPSATKKPRLSLQIKTSPSPITMGKSSTALMADIDPTSITAFNTLSNAYAAAIEMSSPRTAVPPAGSDAKKPVRSSLRLVTNASSQQSIIFPSQHTQTPGPFISYPDTPTAIYSAISPITAHPDIRAQAPPNFTFTPPQSAHPSDDPMANVFSFTTQFSDTAAPFSPRTPRRRATTGTQYLPAPYTHPRSLHSILRNSPLPPRSSLTPMSPTRYSQRLADRAAKKLCFNNPLTQTITTQRYTKSHIDLLAEEASPYSATDPESGTPETLDLTMAYIGDETRDGGQTPGPFEEVRRRLAGLGAESDNDTTVNKKRKRKEKIRKWVWTIGTNEDEVEGGELTPTMASRVESLDTLSQTPVTAIHFPPERSEQTPIMASRVESLDTLSQTPVTAIHCPAERSGQIPMMTLRVESLETLSQTPVTAIHCPLERFEHNLAFATIEKPPRALASPAVTIDSFGDMEMIENPDTSHSV